MGRLTALLVVIFVAVIQSGLSQNFNYADIKDLFQIGGDVKITELPNSRSARNLDIPFEDAVENFIKTNELSIEAPFGSVVILNGKSLDKGEVDLKLQLDSGSKVEARKKSKVKKVLAPILIVLLLKAMTLIPLALGLLGIKTWNALQLSFASFVTSLVLAVWKLCAKFSSHHHPAPTIIHEAVHDVHVPHIYHDSHVVHHDHHDPWDHHYHRSDDSPQQAAYNAYMPENKM